METSIRMGVSLTGGWTKTTRLLGVLPFRLAMAQRKAIRQEAEFLRTKIVDGIVSQAPGGQPFKPLSPYTIAMRTFMRIKSEKALIERGDLVRNIKVKEIDSDHVFVGVLRQAVNREGGNLYNIARIQEYGAGPFVIRLTPKMRAFLHMVFRKMRIPERHGGHGRGYMVITIPPRPFLGPVFEKHAPGVTARMADRMSKLLVGF